MGKSSSPLSNDIDMHLNAIKFSAKLLKEISNLWKKQAGDWGQDQEMIKAWARAILTSGIDESLIWLAFENLDSKRFPPEMGAILCEAESLSKVKINEVDANRSLNRVFIALSDGNLSALNSNELWALKSWPGGSFALRTSTSNDVQKKWHELLLASLKVPPSELPAVVQKPAALLVKKVDKEYGHRKMAEIKAILSPKMDIDEAELTLRHKNARAALNAFVAGDLK